MSSAVWPDRGLFFHPPRDARYHPRRFDRPAGRPVSRPRRSTARGTRPLVHSGLCHRSRDAAVAQLDDDRPLSGRPRRARERAVPLDRHPLVAVALKEAGYQTAAFVSAFVLAKRSASDAGSMCMTKRWRRARRNGHRDRQPIARWRIWRKPRAGAAVRLGALLRRPCALRTGRAVSQPLPLASRIAPRLRRWTNNWAVLSRPLTARQDPWRLAGHNRGKRPW